MLTLDDNTRENKTFFTRTKSKFSNQLVLHKSTNTICGTGHLTNSEFVLVVNVPCISDTWTMYDHMTHI